MKGISSTGFLLSAAAATLLAASCAVEPKVSDNTLAKQYFDSWIALNHPDAVRAGNGIYILEDIPGDGPAWSGEDGEVAFVKYTRKDLSGKVSSTNDEDVAKQVGTYSSGNYYGWNMWYNSTSGLYAGLADALEGMKIGGTREVAIPSWLMVYARYDDEETYLNPPKKKKKKKNDSSSTSSESNAIYRFTLMEQAADIKSWQVDTLERYVSHNMHGVDSTTYDGGDDTARFGFYFLSLKPGTGSSIIPKDSTVYINYTARLLNGKVFDTTLSKTAKQHGIYSETKTYEPVSITWGEKYTDLKMGASGSSMIAGFQACLFHMHPMEKAVCAFWSELGYSYSGSGQKIPPYSPLSFEIELVEAPESDY